MPKLVYYGFPVKVNNEITKYPFQDTTSSELIESMGEVKNTVVIVSTPENQLDFTFHQIATGIFRQQKKGGYVCILCNRTVEPAAICAYFACTDKMDIFIDYLFNERGMSIEEIESIFGTIYEQDTQAVFKQEYHDEFIDLLNSYKPKGDVNNDLPHASSEESDHP